MSSNAGPMAQIPPWLQEQVAKFQKTQQELQVTAMQKQQLDAEKINTSRTLEELKNAKDDESVFKMAGSVLIKTTKAKMISELEERQELANTRITITSKQEARLTESLKEQEAKITEAIKRGQGSAASNPQSSQSPPPPPTSASSPPPSL